VLKDRSARGTLKFTKAVALSLSRPQATFPAAPRTFVPSLHLYRLFETHRHLRIGRLQPFDETYGVDPFQGHFQRRYCYPRSAYHSQISPFNGNFRGKPFTGGEIPRFMTGKPRRQMEI